MSRIAWGITGAGHFLSECLSLLTETRGVDVFLSRAAEDVLRIYHLAGELEGTALPVVREGLPSSPIIGRLFKGTYSVLVVAPATSNTVAKMVCGISDTLVTNLFAQAGKAGVPSIVLPTDVDGVIDSPGPRGTVRVYPREVDLANVDRLSKFRDVRVVRSVSDLTEALWPFLGADVTRT